MSNPPPHLPHRVLLFPPRIVDSKDTFIHHVYDPIINLAYSMQCDSGSFGVLAFRLYSQISRQGRKRGGQYEMQLPHLVRVVSSDIAREGKSFGLVEMQPTSRYNEAYALLVHPSSGVGNGLYLCSLELELTNPSWRLESTEYNFQTKQWLLDDVFSQIPSSQPLSTHITIAVNILQYTAPYNNPLANNDTAVSAIWSWLPSRIEQARAEFNKMSRQPRPGTLYIRFISPQFFPQGSPVRTGGNFLSFFEHIPYPFDAGREVHADVILGNTCYSAVGLPPDPCILKFKVDAADIRTRKRPGEELVELSVADLQSARKYLDTAVANSARIAYDIPVVDFVLPNAVLRYTDPDVDCDASEKWPTLFCSQFALLFLRHCHKQGLVTVREPLRAKALYVCNSHVCSPAHLREIMRILLDGK